LQGEYANIQSLKPNVTRQQALTMLQPQGFLRGMREAVLPPLRSVADVYLPMHLFQVEIENRGVLQTSILGIDAVAGAMDPYRFDRIPAGEETIEVRTRNRLRPVLPAAAAERMLLGKVQRFMYQRGFFRLRETRTALRPIPAELHVPYWLGFYGGEERAKLAVIDAVRRSREGAKARQVFESWLREREE
jgi:hypothetical protein